MTSPTLSACGRSTAYALFHGRETYSQKPTIETFYRSMANLWYLKRVYIESIEIEAEEQPKSQLKQYHGSSTIVTGTTG